MFGKSELSKPLAEINPSGNALSHLDSSLRSLGVAHGLNDLQPQRFPSSSYQISLEKSAHSRSFSEPLNQTQTLSGSEQINYFVRNSVQKIYAEHVADSSTNNQSQTPESTKAEQPLVGIIDTGFSQDDPNLRHTDVILGRDRIDGDNNPLSTKDTRDEHGTQILDTIAAKDGNAPLWLGRAVGSEKWAESLVEFVDSAKAAGKNTAIVNLSFDLTQVNPDGSVTTRTQLTSEERVALKYAHDNGIIVVAAAGNTGGQMSALGQASQEFDNIITVGAAEGGKRANYSSYGNGLTLLADGSAENGSMGEGTSIAAANVSADVAQVWEINPNLNYHQVIEILKSTATDLKASGWDAETGAGLVNIETALISARNTNPIAFERLRDPLQMDSANQEVGNIGLERPTKHWWQKVVEVLTHPEDDFNAIGHAVGHAVGDIVDTVEDGLKITTKYLADEALEVTKFLGDGVSELTRTVGGVTTDVIKTFGDGVVEATKFLGDGVTELTRTVEGVTTDVIKTFGDGVVETTKFVEGVATDFIKDFGNGMVEATKFLGDGVTELTRTVEGVTKRITKNFGNGIIETTRFLFDGLSQFTRTVEGVTTDVIHTFKGVVTATKYLGEGAYEMTKRVGGDIVEFTKAFGNGVVEATKYLADGAIEVTKHLADGTIEIAKNLGDGASEVTKHLINGTVEVTKHLADGTIEIAKDLGNGASEVTKHLINGTVEITKHLADGTIEIAKDLGNGASEVTKHLINGTVEITKHLVDGTTEITKDLGKGLVEVTKHLVDGTAEVTKHLVDGTIEVTKDLGKGLIEVTKHLVDGTVEVTKHLADGTIEITTHLVDGSIEVVYDVSQGHIADAFKHLSETVVDGTQDAVKTGIQIADDANGTAVNLAGDANRAIVGIVKHTGETFVEVATDEFRIGFNLAKDEIHIAGKVLTDTLHTTEQVSGTVLHTAEKIVEDYIRTYVNVAQDAVDTTGQILEPVTPDFVKSAVDWTSEHIVKPLEAEGEIDWKGAEWFADQLKDKSFGILHRAAHWAEQLPDRVERLGNDIVSGKNSRLGKEQNHQNPGDYLERIAIDFGDLIGAGEVYETGADLVKFNTRKLTDHEIEIAKNVFGDSLNYDLVRIDEGALLGPASSHRPYTSFHTINAWGSIDDATLMHELTHVWQYEHDGSIYMPEALVAQKKPGLTPNSNGYDYGGAATLKEHINDGLTYFNYEAQAHIVEDYYKLKYEAKTLKDVDEDGVKKLQGTDKSGNKYLIAADLTDLAVYAHFVEQVSTLPIDQLK